MEEIFKLLHEVDFSFIELDNIDSSLENSDIDLDKLIEGVRVGDFTDRSDYNSFFLVRRKNGEIFYRRCTGLF